MDQGFYISNLVTPIYGWTDIDSYAMYFKGPREETPDA